MNILRFLREQARGYDCNVCGTNHARSDIRVLGKLESAWIVRVTCSKCQTSFKLLVVVDDRRTEVSPVKEEPTVRGRRRRPVTADEVLDAHEMLRTFDGDVAALFRRRERVAGARRDRGI
ncbi:MAG TPA: hypothetical protein VMJ92_01060 [Candidatus Limnocylindrales bacterium]|nr:hypothetical protein [Candidatus Limnocylindrales bacterium]